MNFRVATFYAFLSALALGIVYDYALFLWPLGFVALIPFFFVVDRFSGSLKQTFLVGWIFGATFIGTALVWFWATLPLDWLGIEGAFWGVLTVFYVWGLLSAMLALFIAGFAVLFKVFPQSMLRALVFAPLVWVLCEYLRTFGFFVLEFGPGSDFGPHFTMGSLGYLLSNNSHFLALSSLGGVYILSATVVLINGVVYELLVSTRPFWGRVWRVALVGVVLGIFSLAPIALPAYGNEQDAKKTLSIAVLHTSFDPHLTISDEEFSRRFETLKDMLSQIPKNESGIDIVVLPEDSRFIKTLIARNEAKIFFEAIFGDREILVIDSSRVEDAQGNVVQQLFALNTKTGVIQTAEKKFLLPHGEYLPYLTQVAFTLVGKNDLVAALNKNRSYRSGKDVEALEFKDLSIGALFCSDVLTPVFYNKLADEGVDVFINLASQSWFHGSRIINNQIQNIAAVRAAENNLPFIQASNGSPSFILDERGEVEAESGWEGSSIIYKTLYLSHQ